MAGSMEEEPEVDASRLFRDVGMLILEARMPDDSPKGRHEGPHCPLLHEDTKHVCKEEVKLVSFFTITHPSPPPPLHHTDIASCLIFTGAQSLS
jgi:hypothetical protein